MSAGKDKTEKLLDAATARHEFDIVAFYICDSRGQHAGANWAHTPEQATRILPEVEKAMAEGREVIATDVWDRSVFHARNGLVEHDPGGLVKVLFKLRDARLRQTAVTKRPTPRR